MAKHVLDLSSEEVCGPLTSVPALTDSSICVPRLEEGERERAALHGWFHSLKLVPSTQGKATCVTVVGMHKHKEITCIEGR